MAPLEPETRYLPGEKLEKGKFESPEERMKIFNKSEWDNSLGQVFFNQERAQEILGKNQVQIQHILEEMNQMLETQGKIDTRVFSPSQIQAFNKMKAAENYLKDVHQQLNLLFSKAYEFGEEHQREILKAYSEQFRKDIEGPYNPFAYAQAIQNLINNIKKEQVAPKIWVPVEKFAVEKSSQSFGNAAFESYKKFGSKAPVLVIENPPAGFALSTGEDIKNIVEASRKQFVEKAVESGISKSTAKAQAEKLIGATWDVGHINMLRKYGYTEEEIVKETKKIAPYLKHIHLSDNFGFEQTELPMGMGNVPLKQR